MGVPKMRKMETEFRYFFLIIFTEKNQQNGETEISCGKY